ncbi:LysR family transcriptional regulator [Xylophilus rhododendri]|uniref:LysR family transcriptional regulator n=1 Tax=Xylophilus rhododendri TaxID=2697032 RepID=A0A857J183_9BURK|nr:LysR substrate-binding domain-containing protein [Xylophilus rhododendri]QHI97013.1 LysR family transcriptional regulator [Xylophilus rhododendri]
MKFHSLATLTAVLRHGSFAAAAEHVNVTPSAVSLQMKQLEEYFRQPLFDRSGRSVRPTPFAEQLARTVDRAIEDIEALRNVADLELAGRVRLGITESAQTTLLPRAFADLQRQAPQIQLQIERGTTPGLLNSLKAGLLDVAVVFRPSTGGSSRLRWTDLGRERFVLLVPDSLTPGGVADTLRAQPWIRIDRELVAGKLAARFVDSLVPNKQALVDLPGVEAIVAMVAMGIGVSVLPELRPELLGAYPVREVSLGRQAPVRQMALVRRAADGGNRRIDRVEQAFLNALAPV